MRTGGEDDSMKLLTWKRENLPSISAKQSVCWQTRKWHRRRGAARFERIWSTEKTSVAASILFRARCESAWAGYDGMTKSRNAGVSIWLTSLTSAPTGSGTFLSFAAEI